MPRPGSQYCLKRLVVGGSRITVDVLTVPMAFEKYNPLSGNPPLHHGRNDFPSFLLLPTFQQPPSWSWFHAHASELSSVDGSLRGITSQLMVSQVKSGSVAKGLGRNSILNVSLPIDFPLGPWTNQRENLRNFCF